MPSLQNSFSRGVMPGSPPNGSINLFEKDSKITKMTLTGFPFLLCM